MSDPSGALAVRYQRQQSAGSSSRAWSMNTPRLAEVENLPPYQFSQLKAFSTSTVFHGSPEPRMVEGKVAAWKATLSLPITCT